MMRFTFDAKVFLTIEVEAEDEKAARAALDDMIERVVTGSSWVGKTRGIVSSAGQDGDAYLMDIDGEPT